MAENKYNLDFSLWGTTSLKKIENDSGPGNTIGKGWSSSPKPAAAAADATYVAPSSKTPEKVTCTLKKAYFVPDSITGFNKPCTIKVELEGQPKGPLSIALWAVYKGTHYDLQHTRTVNASKATVEDMLSLYYVDQHFDDLHGRGETDAKVEYYAIITCKGARMLESDRLEMPLSVTPKAGSDQKAVTSKLSGSVGAKSDNKAADVKMVKKRLKELGYPVPDETETCCADTIKSIKFFQTRSWGSAIGSVALPDGQISKGKSTEKALFSDTAPKYTAPVKGSVKTIQNDEQTKMNNATGNDKTVWDKIKEVWNEVSPYLPAGSHMTSGYRSEQEQRDIIYRMYNTTYKKDLKSTYGDAVYEKYKNLQNKNDDAAEKEMCRMIKKAANQDIASPKGSKHISGKAIDIGGTEDNKQVEILRWYSAEFPDKKHVARIFKERNGCVHFEFE